jgi:DNA-binding response OmpR family regulator
MARRKTILIVDDDPDLREALAEQFREGDEFSVVEAEDANSAIASVQDGGVDAVILDVNLPDMDGRAACRQMRELGAAVPIIMLTGQTADADQIGGLESGANDYVTKPFKFDVLLARLRAHLRSHEKSEEAVFQIGPYEFRPALKIMLAGDRKVRLTEKETNILKYLYRAGPAPVAREELLHEVWGYNAGVTTHTLETHVYRLRQKIEPDPANARLLITEAGGYRLAP